MRDKIAEAIERSIMWLAIALAVYSITSCAARVTEARYKALENCNGTCIY